MRLLKILFLTSLYAQVVAQERFDVPEDTLDSKNSLVGSTPVTTYDYTFAVSLSYMGTHICGGALVSNSIILTAAHCITTGEKYDLTQWMVSFHRLDLEGPDNSPFKPRPFINWRITEHFNPDTMVNDHAAFVMDISDGIDLSEYAIPVDATGEFSVEGTETKTFGWGAIEQSGQLVRTNQLREAAMYIQDPTYCADYFTYFNNKPHAFDANSMMCTYAENTGSCGGDSGGPVVSIKNEIMVLVGLVSWGPETCGLKGDPSVNVSIYQIGSWIASIYEEFEPTRPENRQPERRRPESENERSNEFENTETDDRQPRREAPLREEESRNGGSRIGIASASGGERRVVSPSFDSTRDPINSNVGSALKQDESDASSSSLRFDSMAWLTIMVCSMLISNM